MRESETRNAFTPLQRLRRIAAPAIRRSGDPASPPRRKIGETGGGGQSGASVVRGEIEPSHAAPSRQSAADPERPSRQSAADPERPSRQTAIEPQRRLAHEAFDQQYADMLSRLPRRDAHGVEQIISEFATNG